MCIWCGGWFVRFCGGFFLRFSGNLVFFWVLVHGLVVCAGTYIVRGLNERNVSGVSEDPEH